MTRGCLIFAHNNRDVDYAKLALLSGSLAKKNLGLPVSLITDESTISWMKESKIFSNVENTFDKLILVERPNTENKRILHDGTDKKIIPFINSTRADAYNLSPYDQTLLLDSDFLIFSDRLNQYWDVESSVKVSYAANDINSKDRLGYHDKYVSDTGIKLFWATTVMFNKDENSKLFFDLVDTVKTNYSYFADLYMFNPTQYRNDISFSIAQHIMSGFETDIITSLPPLLTTIDKDILESVDQNKLTFLIAAESNSYVAAAIKDTDIHIMNKQSILRNYNSLMELV